MLLIAFTSQTVGIFNIAIAQETTVIEVVENNENFPIENENLEEKNLDKNIGNENQNVENNENLENNLEENIDNETEGLENIENQDENLEILENPEISENENNENLENTENENLENAIVTRTTTDNIETIENIDNNDLSGKIELRILTEDKNEDGSPKNEYYTGEEILTYAEFRVSGADFMIANASTRITIPRAQLDWRPIFSKTDASTTWRTYEDNDNYYAEYNYENLRGGNIVAAPVTFKWLQYTTKWDFETPVKIEMLDGQKNVIKEHIVNYKAKVHEPIPYMKYDYSSSNWYNSKDIKINGIDLKELNLYDLRNFDTGFTRSVEFGAPYIVYSIWFDISNKSYGKYRPDRINAIIEIPDWAIVDEAYLNKDCASEYCWIKLNEPNKFEINYDYGYAYIKLLFPNFSYNEIFSPIAKVKLLEDSFDYSEELKVYTKWIFNESDIYKTPQSLSKEGSVNIMYLRSTEDLELTPSWQDAPVIKYDIWISKYNATSFNELPVKIIEKLPEGAKMNWEVNNEWKYCYYNINSIYSCWIYDSDNHTAIFEWYLAKYRAVIELIYPEQSFDKIHHNVADVFFYPNTNKEYISTVDNYTKIVFSKIQPEQPYWQVYINSSSSSRVIHRAIPFNKDNSNTSVSSWYTYSIYNTNNSVDYDENWPIVTNVKEIILHDLDDRLYYDSIFFNQNTSSSLREKIKNTWYKVYGILEDNNEELIWVTKDVVTTADILTDDNHTEINDTEYKYKKIKIVFDSLLKLDNERLELQVNTYVKLEEWEKWQEDPSVLTFDPSYIDSNNSRSLNSSVKIVYSNSNSNDNKLLEQFKKEHNLFYSSYLDISFSNGNNYTVVYSDDNTRSMNSYINISNNGNTSVVAKNIKYILLLPIGIDYVDWTAGYTEWIEDPNINWDEWETVFVKFPTSIIKNYKNTWRNAVIFDIWNYSWWFDYKIDVKSYTNEWDNLLEHFLVWDNQFNIIPKNYSYWWANIYTDELDLDNDWDKTEKFLRWTSVIRFIPPREILLKKLVSTDSVSWALDTFADITDNVFYKINILNNSLRELNNLEILDVLPFVGDHNISPNDNNTYSPRGSEYNIELSDSLESIPQNTDFLDKFEVLYSTIRQWSDLSSVRDEEFVTADEIADFSTVKNIKIRLKEGQIFPVKQEASFIIKAKQIVDHTIENLKVSHNSSAFSLNEIDFSEWNKATTTIVKYQIQWKIFHDTNKNWNIDENEKSLANYSLALFNSDWTPVVDSQTNSPLITNSDNNGNYVFDVYKRWDYFVKLTKKFPEEIPTILTENNSAIIDDSDVENMTLKTNIFTLDPSNIKIQNPHSHGSSLFKLANFGLNYPSAKITINKIDEQNPEIKIANAVFEIKKDNIVLDTVVTDNNWIATTRELPIGYEYEIVEISTPATYQKSKPQNIKIETEGEIEYEILSIKTPILIPVSVLTWNTSFRSFAGGGISTPIINNFSSKENILPNFSIFWENFVENKNSTKIIFDIKNENLENSENNFTQNSQNFSWNLENTEIIDDLFSPDFAKNTEKNNFDLKEKFLQNIKNQISNFYENKSENLEKFLSENSLENIEKILEENILLEKFNFDKNFIQNNLSEIIENSENFEEKNYIKNFLEEKILNSANNSEKEIFTILDNNFDIEFSDYAEYLKNSTNINPQKNINSESNDLFSPNFSEIKNTKLKANYLPATGLVDDFRIIIFILSMIFAFPIAFLSRKNFYKNP